VISAATAAPRCDEASIGGVGRAHYDGLADDYAAFVDEQSPYYQVAADALRRLLGPGAGRCLDLGCGGGHFTALAADLGWQVTGIELSRDQLRHARARLPDVELVQADAASLPFPAASFDATFSTFTHTDFDDFAAAVREARRVLRPGGRLVYIGNHPCFVGATQEHGPEGCPVLHPGYRRAGRWSAAAAPGTTPGGWRARVGSFVHLPLAQFLEAFSGLALVACEEPADDSEYPKTIALAWEKPRA
jgi:SAM-dependent methyltransferase